jgi:hypothetical protein
MTEHKTGTREEWLAGRLELLEAEKELTRRGDELARKRKGAALGGRRGGVPLRHRRRNEDAGGAVRRSLAVARLPLHVRPDGRRLAGPAPASTSVPPGASRRSISGATSSTA